MKQFNTKKEKKIKNNNQQFLINLFNSTGHLGYSKSQTNPNNLRFLKGFRFNTAIIDLSLTVQALQRVFIFIEKNINKLKFLDKKILLICNDPKHKQLGSLLITPSINLLFTVLTGPYNSKILVNSKTNKINYSLIIILSTTNFHLIINDAKQKLIPVVSLIDTNINSTKVNYPICINTVNSKAIFFSIYCFKKFFKQLKL